MSTAASISNLCIAIDGGQVFPVTSIRNLGIFIDADVQGSAWDRAGVSRTCCSCHHLLGRKYLWSAGTNHLVVPLFKLSKIGIRAFPVAGPCVWYSLPADITSVPSLSTFRQLCREGCSPAPTAHPHRYFVVRDPTWRFRPLHHWPPTISSTPFDNFRTNFWQLIRYRRRSSSRWSMWLRRSLLCCSTDRWLPAIFLSSSRRRFSPYREEAGAWHHRRLLVSTDFEPVCAVEVTRTPRCSSAEGLFNVRCSWKSAQHRCSLEAGHHKSNPGRQLSRRLRITYDLNLKPVLILVSAGR